MKRKTAIALSAALLFSMGALSSCTWKKSAEEPSAPASNSANSDGGKYSSGASTVEENGDGVERSEFSSGSALSLGSAINSENLSACEKLPAADAQACEDLVNFKIGTENHDYDACDKIERTRNRQICTSRVSKYYLDFGTCEQVRDESVKKACLVKTTAENEEIVKRTAEAQKKIQEAKSAVASAGTPKERVEKACASATGKNRTYCFSTKVDEEIAKSGDASLCALVPDAWAQSACKQKASAKGNKAVLDSAIAAKNPTLCDTVSTEQDRVLCKKIVNGTK